MEKSNDDKSSENGESYKRQRQTPRCNSDEINYLLYRYLQECGFVHAAYTFGHESMLLSGQQRPVWQRTADKTLPPGALVTFLQKGLQYVGIEESLRENKKAYESEMTLLSPASIQALNRKNPPIQLTVPPAAAAAAVKARLAAEAEAVSQEQAPAVLAARQAIAVTQAVATQLQLQQQQQIIQQMNQNAILPPVIEEPAAVAPPPPSKRSASSSSKRSSKKQKLQKTDKDKAPSFASLEQAMAQLEAAKQSKQDDNDIVMKSADMALLNGEHNRNGKYDKIDRGAKGVPAQDKGITDENDMRRGRKTPDSEQASNEPLLPTPDDVLLLNKHSSEVFMCAWNPVNTNLIATGSADASARIWELNGSLASDGLKTSIELPHGDHEADRTNKDVTTLEWSSDGKILATGSYDGIARVWDQKGTLIHTLRGHKGPIFSLKWNRSGTFLLSGSYDKTMIVWNVNKSPTDEKGYVERRFSDHLDPVLDVDWKDDTMFASCSADKTVHVYSIANKLPIRVYKGHEDEVNSVKWSPSGKYLASCSDDCTAKVWDVDPDVDSGEEPLYDLVDHEQEIYTVKWSPLSSTAKVPLLATASFDGAIRLWNVNNGSCVGCFNQHRESVYSVAFSPSGDYLASGSLMGQLYVWDVETHECVKAYKGNGDIFEVAWNKEETRVAACFSTNVVAVVDFKRDAMVEDSPANEDVPPRETVSKEAPPKEDPPPKEELPKNDQLPIEGPSEEGPSRVESSDEPRKEEPRKDEPRIEEGTLQGEPLPKLAEPEKPPDKRDQTGNGDAMIEG